MLVLKVLNEMYRAQDYLARYIVLRWPLFFLCLVSV